MKYGKLPAIDKPISRIVQGCMMLSDKDPAALEESFRILDAAWAVGITCFDNAIVYGGGMCQRTLGKWMEARGNRAQVVLLDKGCHHNADRRRVTPHDIDSDLADSMARLRTNFIDIWGFHRDDPTYPVGPLVERLNEHIRSGRIGCYIASNWSVARIAEANAYASARGLQGFAGSSPNFSLAEQVDEPWKECSTISGPERAADRRWYTDSRMPLFTWSSLARGFLSGRITRANAAEMKAKVEEHVFRCYGTEDNFRRLDRLQELAAARGCTVAQVALAFVLNQEFDAYALVASYNREEADANAAAVDLVLSPAERDWLDLRRDRR